MFEHHTRPLLSRPAFVFRIFKHLCAAFSIIFFALSAGAFGYHSLEHFSWIDSYLEAAMLLGGMGPVQALKTDAGKLFAICYALFSGLIFLVVMGIVFAPIVHRLLHQFHLELDEEN